MPGDLFQFKNKEHYAFVGTANRWKPPSTSQSVQAWAKSCPFQCFPLYSCALALDHGVVCLRNCWPTKAINVYDETVSVMIESPHLDISNKNSKKTKLLYVGLCLCVSFMHKSYVYTSLIIYKIIYDFYVSHFLSPILSLQRLFFVELPAAASPLTWSQYLPVRLGNLFNLIQTWWQGIDRKCLEPQKKTPWILQNQNDWSHAKSCWFFSKPLD